jgi:gliding motility associated protien GldN
MRPIYFFSLLLIFLALAHIGFSQDQPAPPRRQQIQNQIEEQRRLQAERNQNRQNKSAEVQEQPARQNSEPARKTRQRSTDADDVDKTSTLTERAKIKNMDNSKTPIHTVWLREIIKMIDLDKGDNAALKYPIQPMGDRVNLFTLIFQLISDKKIEVYKYIQDRDPVFTEDTKISFEEILKKNEIPYTMEGSGEKAKFIVDEIDNPSQDVLKYFIKEGWFFDEATGTFNSKVTAICPIMVRIDYNDNTTRTTPICWIPYENIRPYLSRTLIMTSDYNNALTYTIDDYFTKKMYSGDIMKTVNMRNQTLAQQVGADPAALKHAQDSIEKQLKFFEKQLWIQADTTTVAANKKEKKTTVKASRGSDATKEKTKEAKAPKAKPEKTSSTPTRSVRRTR